MSEDGSVDDRGRGISIEGESSVAEKFSLESRKDANFGPGGPGRAVTAVKTTTND